MFQIGDKVGKRNMVMTWEVVGVGYGGDGNDPGMLLQARNAGCFWVTNLTDFHLVHRATPRVPIRLEIVQRLYETEHKRHVGSRRDNFPNPENPGTYLAWKGVYVTSRLHAPDSEHDGTVVAKTYHAGTPTISPMRAALSRYHTDRYAQVNSRWQVD